MDINKKKSVISKCDKIANKFLELATEFKALSKSMERTTDRKEIDLIKKIIEHKAKHLGLYFENVKGGIKE